jgi:hypothetical protein
MGGAVLPEAADSIEPWHVEGVRLHGESRRRRRREAAEGADPHDVAAAPGLSRRLTIAQAVAVYRQAVGQIAAAFEDIKDAEERLNAVFASADSGRSMTVPTSYPLSFSDPEAPLKEIQRQAWECLVDRLEVRRMMSIKRANELDEQLKRGDMPEITEENVAALARGFESQIGQMLREAVTEVFEFLRPPGSEYKTNSELEIGERVVLRWMVESGWGRSAFHVNYQREAHLTATENVFRALAGGGMHTRGHRSDLSNAINACGKDGKGETEFFAFRAFKNRNLHIRFRRLDLLKQLNAIAGGMRLRPAKVGG